jgi:flagella basal body P-ring formation protein FlgA
MVGLKFSFLATDMQYPCQRDYYGRMAGGRHVLGNVRGKRQARAAILAFPGPCHRGHAVLESAAMLRLFLLLLAAFTATPGLARQEAAPVKKAVEDYLRVQTQGLPGQVSFTVGTIDPNNNLAPCAALEVSQPPGARTWGRTNVSVRCTQDGGWTMFVPVNVRVVADYLVTARPLSQGQVVTEADFSRQTGDLSELPTGILTDLRQIVGRTAAMSIPVGRPLRGDMLRLALAVQQGQSVKVVSKGPGFQVANEGRALNGAAEGQTVQVRLGNGQVVSGVARGSGYVEVGY